MDSRGKSTRARPPRRKLSEIILEFIGPGVTEPGAAPQHWHVALAVQIWNCMLLPKKEQDEELRAIARRLKLTGSDVHAALQDLLRTRKKLYGADRRIVAQYQYNNTGGKPSLIVASVRMEA